MRFRILNIIFIVLILLWILADHHFNFGRSWYGWLLLLYLIILFCGTYFIQWGFFLRSVNSVKTNKPYIALSFDDGPDARQTQKLLDILKDNDTKAVFFCIGRKIQGNEAILERMVREGHIIGNHSFTHNTFFDLYSSGRMTEELKATNLAIHHATGLSPLFFRPPYGVTNPNLAKSVKNGGFTSIGWSIRSFDTVIRDEEKLLKRILGSLKPGAILLLHDTCEITLAILPRLLAGIRQAGYKTERLDKMINLNPYA